MKKLSAIAICVLILSLVFIIPILAENVPEIAVNEVQTADSVDDQLGLLYNLSLEYAAKLQTGIEGVDLDIRPAGEVPARYIPETENAEISDGLPESLRNAKFVVFCDEFETDGSFSERIIPGYFYACLPMENRAKSLGEAGGVLYITHGYQVRNDYIGGKAYNRIYYLYAADLTNGTVYRIDGTSTKPPLSGMGVLAGERLSWAELWKRFEASVLNVPLVVEYPEGTATFRVTQGGCCMIGLNGSFTRFEVPQTVEGRTVVGINKIKSSDLTELILPEGLEWIDGRNAIECQSLSHIQFPSTLKRITGEDVFWYNPWPGHPLKTLDFNEGLEEIGEDSLMGSWSIRSITLPDTLHELGTGFLKNGLGCGWVALSEGLERLPGQFLSTSGYVACVYLPASIVDFAYNALNQDIRIYTPEGSPASQWAEERGFSWFPCNSAEEMPRPEIGMDGDYEYSVLNGEAELLRYYGRDEEVTVPDTLGGAPVRVIHNYAFTSFEGNNYSNRVRVLQLPDGVKKIKSPCVYDGYYLEKLIIPSSVENCEGKIVRKCDKCTVFSSADSPAREACEENGIPFSEWEP